MLISSNPPNIQCKESFWWNIVIFSDFEEVSILYEGIKKMVKSQIVNKFIASMSSLIQCFAAIVGSIREKTKMDITRLPPALNGYLSEIRF